MSQSWAGSARCELWAARCRTATARKRAAKSLCRPRGVHLGTVNMVSSPDFCTIGGAVLLLKRLPDAQADGDRDPGGAVRHGRQSGGPHDQHPTPSQSAQAAAYRAALAAGVLRSPVPRSVTRSSTPAWPRYTAPRARRAGVGEDQLRAQRNQLLLQGELVDVDVAAPE
jgi:hypothetical protein